MKKTVTQLLRQWKESSGKLLLSGMLLGSALASQGQILITQDFSTGSGTTAPSGWTTAATSSSGTAVNWTFSGARSVTGGTPGFVANYAILDSDAGSASGEDATLESPAFDASVAGTYRLEFDNQYRAVTSSPEGTPTVEVWNGSAWTAVLTYPAVSDGYTTANHKTINITTATGGSTVAKVRFHWVNGSDDWWWAVDNVTITRLNCVAPTATYTIVPNCGSNQFSVDVNITSMGNATSISINEGATPLATATTTGITTVGPFTSSSSHTLTLVHNVNTLCNLTSPVQTYNCPPPNDEAANATSLTVNANYLCGNATNSSTILATQSADAAPSCSNTGINDDVWFSFVATNANHRISFSNVVSGTMVAALYTGTPGSLTAVSGACASTTLNATGLIPGTTYYVRAYTNTAATTTTTNFTICIGTLPPPPANDECAGAVNVPVNAGTTCSSVISGTLQSATASTGPASSCGTYDDDVWYSFVATNARHVITLQNVAGSVTDLTFQVLSSCGAATALLCSDPNMNLVSGLTPGNTYYIRIASYTSTGGQNTTFDVCVSIPPPAPANDECATATVVPVNGPSCTSVVSGTLVGATASAGPASGCGTYDDDVWYAFTATATVHTITLQNLAGSTTDLTFQVLNSCGAATALVCSDPQNATVTGLTPGNTYYLRVASYTNTPLQTSTFDVCITTNIMTYTSCTTTQASSSAVTAGTTNQQILRVAVVVNGIANPISVSQIDFNTTGSTNASDIVNAKVYYTGSTATFGTSTPFGTTVISPNGSFSITGNQVLAGDPTSSTTNYFWLAYDVGCSATQANVLDGQCLSVVVGGINQTPTATNPSGTRAINSLLGTNQPATSGVAAGTSNSQVLRVDVQPCGASSTVESITFNTASSTAPASDVAAAKVYYTTSTSFGTTTPYGTAVANPNGTFTVAGSQAITGQAYFWLVYDLNCTATPANVIDASCSSVTMSGTAYAVPTPNPTGTRAIQAPSYTAATNQPSSTSVTAGSANNIVLRVDAGGCTNSPVTSLTFNTTGTTNVADIVTAKVYFTTNTTFTTTSLFGSFPAPNGVFTITGNQPLATGTGYFWLTYDLAASATAGNVVDASCASAIINGSTVTPATANPSGTRAIVAATLANDNASGAIALTVGAGCTGNPYSNVNSSMSAGEPYPSCSGSPCGTVWFSFVAPASGAVRVSTDITASGFLDHKAALFSATNVNDYGTFNIISCDDDGGSSSSLTSVLYATGLTAGTTYYIAVDRFQLSSTTGTFCIAVDELASSMLATSNTCSSTYQAPGGAINYTGWVPLQDGSSRLIALVRNTAGVQASTFTVAQNVNTGAVRQDANGLRYLDRNFRITNTNPGTYDVQLFMLTSEQAALQTADPAATLGNLNITRQTGESVCTNNFSSGGTNTLITQSGNGSANGVSWIQFSTTGFSNFFINAGSTPLPVILTSFSGKNAGAVNLLNWETSMEQNFSHFELQRSADGSSFSKLGIVNAKGIGSYTYTDDQPFEGQNIYRLKMVDRDGKATLSEAVKLMVKKGNGLSVNVHPNPVNQQLHIGIAGKIDGKAWIHVLDITGKVLQTLSVAGNSMTIDMSSFAAGTYMIRYTDSSHNSVVKISKN